MNVQAVTGVFLALPALLSAQSAWEEPRAPCGIRPADSTVSAGMASLKSAVEQPQQRKRLLERAGDALTRSIVANRQDQNPAAWYYLGRYYVETFDPRGADSAFTRAERLAPRCADDIEGHRQRLWSAEFNDAVRFWQDGKRDSAVTRLRLAEEILPSDPRTYLMLGRLWAAENAVDPAVIALRRAVTVAQGDTAFAREHREALTEIARILARRGQASPVLQAWQQAKYSRDSLERFIANDSIIMARILESAASRRERDHRLSASDQQVFARDSAARADSVERGRVARAALIQRAMADSAALAAAFAPAMAAYHALLEAFPASPDAAATLATLYAQIGLPEQGAAAIERLRPHLPAMDAAELFDTGRRLAELNVRPAAARAYELVLDKNPYHRDGLLGLTRAYLHARDAPRALATARRLLAIDPSNRGGVRLFADAWALSGAPDSAVKYRRVADSGLVLDVAVTSFQVENGQAVLGGTVNNTGTAPSGALRIVVEFLDAAGAVRASQVVNVPSIPAGQSRAFETRAAGQRIRGWRYRLS
jgi:cytochrome c-type biogenesis protein CcmH/NrfG